MVLEEVHFLSCLIGDTMKEKTYCKIYHFLPWNHTSHLFDSFRTDTCGRNMNSCTTSLI